jgi:hypothetical protein
VDKALGLAPFSFKIDSATNKKVIDIKFTSNIGGFAVSAVIFVTLIIGFVFYAVEPEFTLRSDPGHTLCNAITVPTSFLCSLTVVIINSTVGRHKFQELLNKLNATEEGLCRLRGGYAYRKKNNKVQLHIPLLVFIASFMVYDSLVWSKEGHVVARTIHRFSQIIVFAAEINYCKVIQMLRRRLSSIHEVLTLTSSDKLSQTNTPYMMDTEDRKVVNKTCSFTSGIIHVSSVDVLRNPVPSRNATVDLKILPLTETQKILNLRIIYNQLYECAKIISFLYGVPILIDIFDRFTGLTVNLYAAVRLFREPTEAVSPLHSSDFVVTYTVWTSLHFGTIISLTAICEMASGTTKGIGHKVETLLLQNPLTGDLLEQLKLFSHQTSNDKIEFSAAGFFIINLSLLCTFMASVTTYIVILVQFKSH